MPSLKNTAGLEFFFPAGAVNAVSDHDDTGQAGTYVYGVGPVPLNIAESVAGFLARLNLQNTFITLTRPSNVTVWVNPAAIGYVRAAGAGDPPGEKSEVGLGGHVLRLVEDPAGVVSKVNAKLPGRF